MGQTISVEMVDGAKVIVPDDLTLITPYVLQEQHDWFEDEIKFLRRLLQLGDRVLDIGANYGVYTASMARAVGPTGRVCAFEPASRTASFLRQSIAANDFANVEVIQQALSDHTGRAVLAVNRQSELNTLMESESQQEGEAVELTTLDAWMRSSGWQQLDLVKINAEGAELRILEGGKEFFSTFSPLIQYKINAGAELHLELIEAFEARGYASFRLNPGLDLLVPFEGSEAPDGFLLNLFCARSDRVENLQRRGWLVSLADLQMEASAEASEEERQSHDWTETLTRFPYGEQLQSRWLAGVQSRGRSEVEHAIALYAISQNDSLTAARRFCCLRLSAQLLRKRCSIEPSIGRLASLARVARDYGARTLAVVALGHVIDRLKVGEAWEPEEAFLVPNARFEAILPDRGHANWMLAAALEEMERLGSFSSFYTGEQSRARLEQIQETDYADAEIGRRLTLITKKLSVGMHKVNKNVGAAEDIDLDAFQVAIERREGSADIFYQCGQALAAKGRPQEALQALLEADRLEPGTVAYLRGIAEIYRFLGDFHQAIHFGRKALLRKPDQQDLATQLAHIYECAGNYAGTIEFFRIFRQQHPEHFEAAYQLAFALNQMGRGDEALETIMVAIALNPNSTKALGMVSQILFDIGRFHEAIDVSIQALRIEPNTPHILQLLIKCYNLLGLYDQAIQTAEEALRAQPENLAIIIGLATAHRLAGNLSKSMAIFEDVLKQDPTNQDAYFCQLFNYSIAPLPARNQMLNVARAYWECVRDASFAKETDIPAHFVADYEEGSRIRVGILSADIGEHVVSRFLRPFLKHYDRSKIHVEIITNTRRYEESAVAIMGLADHCFSIQGLTLSLANTALRKRRYDLIVETSGITKDSTLPVLARRCAPVQCHYIGYHASTGLDTIDYFIGDDTFTPAEFESQFSESLVRLPRVWLAYDPGLPMPQAYSTSSFDGPILGSFSQTTKVGDETMLYWGAALSRVPESILVIKDRSSVNPSTREKILLGLEKQGIDPKRILFYQFSATQRDHLDAYNSIDIALDTTPWSSSTTAFDALGMGVPLVAICGDCSSARMSTSIVRSLGKFSWIAHSPLEFSDISVELCGNFKEIRAGKAEFQREVLLSSLYDGKSLCNALTRFILSATKKSSFIQK